jgi:putative flippase GtrA
MLSISSRLPKKFNKLWQYAIFASFGLAVDYAVLIFLKEVLGAYYLLAVCGGFISGLVITYILTNKYVFGKPKGSHTVIFTLFGIIGLGGLIILNVLVWLLTGKLGLNYILSKTIATVFVFLWNFYARNKLYQES